MQDCSNSIAYALELLQSYTKPSVCTEPQHTQQSANHMHNSWNVVYVTLVFILIIQKWNISITKAIINKTLSKILSNFIKCNFVVDPPQRPISFCVSYIQLPSQCRLTMWLVCLEAASHSDGKASWVLYKVSGHYLWSEANPLGSFLVSNQALLTGQQSTSMASNKIQVWWNKKYVLLIYRWSLVIQFWPKNILAVLFWIALF